MQDSIYDAVIQIVQVKRSRQSRQASASDLRRIKIYKRASNLQSLAFFGSFHIVHNSYRPTYSFKKSQSHDLLQNVDIGGLGRLLSFCLSTWAGLRPPADQEIFRNSRRGRRRDFLHVVLRRDNGAVPRPDSTRSRNKLGPI